MAGAEKDSAAVSVDEAVGAMESVPEVPEVDLTGGKGGPVYVVQLKGPGAYPGVWEDFASVTAPARSKRKTIIEAAMRSDAGKQVKLPGVVRVLDADAAKERPVGLREREPELVIG